MENIDICIQLDEGAKLPEYAHYEDACMDMFSNCDITLKPGERGIVKTGVHIEVPLGYEAQVRSRSGLALKKGICVLNAPGIIDTGYTGEIGVILINLGSEEFEVKKGDKIAQIIILPILHTNLKIVEKLEDRERGANGFGSTGV